MIKVLKASAGTGKTYNLALEYIRLVVGSDRPDIHRHILAVTFTNKATEEMKRRILKELHTLAVNPSESNYYNDLVPGTVPDGETLRKRAGERLSSILHDYSAFAVSTIDRFFQQTLRAFSREIGQFASYQVELDRKALETESVDRVLDSLGEGDRGMLEWLTEGAKADLAKDGRFSLEKRLSDMASSLKDLPEGSVSLSRTALRELDRVCRGIISAYRERVKSAAKDILDCLTQNGVEPESSTRGWLKHVTGYSNLSSKDALEYPKDSFFANREDPSKWFPKARDSYRAALEGKLEKYLDAFAALFEDPYKEYRTAVSISDRIYSLGAAAELRRAFSQIQKEKNVISIDDSNSILHGIIDGTPAPFIYEKLGVRYENFLLDEFQDTSRVQWENFLPLIKNSNDSGFESLVVGDVKQSIYRWRGSDWNLLGSGLEEEFRGRGITTLNLKENWRTCREIVHFNNEFFTFASESLGLSEIYAGLEQNPSFPCDAPGSVEVVFTQDQMQEVLDTIAVLRDSHGASYSDIAILVRGNREGAKIAQALVENSIPVVSDDSLFVKSSVTVRRLVSQMSLVDSSSSTGTKENVATYLAGTLDIEIPSNYHSLTDLAEGLLRELKAADPQRFNAEIPYIQSFMDYLQDFSSGGVNNLGAFLRAWEEAQPKIASPASGSAVNIMTVHKSKGLEFPFVIFPFADKVTLYKASEKWCEPSLTGTSLEGKAEGYYNVNLDSNSEQSYFASSYHLERRLQVVDNLNIFYVALTRPVYGIKIIAAEPPKSAKEMTNLSQLLYSFIGNKGSYIRGEHFDFSTLTGKNPADGSSIESTYPSYPADSGRRLVFSPEAADYFGEDGSFGPEASTRIRGNVLHGILADIRVPGDIPAAVSYAVSDGLLPSSLEGETVELLKERISCPQAIEWFSPEAKLLLEESIIDAGGKEYRPDRVVMLPGGKVRVIDYKFGKPEEKYLYQVRRYVSLFKRMGYSNVQGFLWYVPSGVIESV